MKIAILTSGILPIPAVQGGAVENLIKAGAMDTLPGNRKQKLMVYGNVTGAYYEKKDAPIATPDEPTTTAPSTKPTASPDPTSATGTTKGSSNNPSTNSGNGSVATGDFSFAAVLFVVVAGAAGVFYFTRKKYNK